MALCINRTTCCFDALIKDLTLDDVWVRRVFLVESTPEPATFTHSSCYDGNLKAAFTSECWRAGCGDHHSFAAVNHRRASGQVRAITTLSYRNQSICYARTVAYSAGSAMLFSSGDSPQNASSILSGEGFDEVYRGESPFVVSAVFHQAKTATLAAAGQSSGEKGSDHCPWSEPK